MQRSFVRTLKLGIILSLAFGLLSSIAINAHGGPPADVQARVAEIKERAKNEVNEKRESAQQKSQEKRQEACERRSAKVGQAVTRIGTSAEKLLGVMDSFYERVQGFYESGQLTVSNYDKLNSAVEAAHLNAEASIEALGELEFTVDCEDSNIAEAIATYREASSEVREDLRDYRKALVDLISSMRAEAAEENADSDDSSDDSDEGDEEVDEETSDDNQEDES